MHIASKAHEVDMQQALLKTFPDGLDTPDNTIAVINNGGNAMVLVKQTPVQTFTNFWKQSKKQ